MTTTWKWYLFIVVYADTYWRKIDFQVKWDGGGYELISHKTKRDILWITVYRLLSEIS